MLCYSCSVDQDTTYSFMNHYIFVLFKTTSSPPLFACPPFSLPLPTPFFALALCCLLLVVLNTRSGKPQRPVYIFMFCFCRSPSQMEFLLVISWNQSISRTNQKKRGQ